MSLYVDANYTVDDAGYFTDNPTGTYVECNFWITSPDYYAEGDDTCPIVVTTTNKGDDADGRRGVRPIVQIRPKVERDLDDTLEIIETIASEKRPKENRDTAKTALAALREVQIPISFEEPIAKVEQGLAKLSRRTFKKYGAMQQAAMRVAAELEAVIAEMERRRKRRQREEEAIFWLLN